MKKIKSLLCTILAAALLLSAVPAYAAGGFSDVSDGDYYAGAVAWAKEAGVTGGTSDATFSPKNSVTRAQAVTFLWAAAGRPEPASNSSPFTDVADPGAYYYKPVLWAREKGITGGVSADRFDVSSPVHYDQFLAFLCRAAGGELSGDWSQAAMSWAGSKGLTSGLSVAAGSDCPRADVVYFLWKQYGGGSSEPVQITNPTSPDRPVVNTEAGLNGAVCAKEDFDMSVYAAKAHVTEGLNFPDELNSFDPNGPKNILVIVSGNYGIDTLEGKSIARGYKFDVYDYRNGVYTFIAQFDTTKLNYNYRFKAEEVPANPAAMIAPSSLTTNASGFTDLKEGDPHYEAIMALVKNDIIAGYADGRFGADDPVMTTEASWILGRLRGNKTAKPASQVAPVKGDTPFTRGLTMNKFGMKSLKLKTAFTIEQINETDATKLRAYATEHPYVRLGRSEKENIKEELDILVNAYNAGVQNSIGGVGDMDDWLTRGELCQICYDLGYTTWGSLK